MAATSISSVASEPEHNTKSRELEEENATKTGAADDEDTGAQVAPIVKLEEVPVTTGEEDEDAILDLKAKLYRFVKEGNQWKERGVGTVKLLKHKDSAKVRLVFRQSKTLKICANHLDCKTFKETVEEVAESQGKKEETKDAADAAGLLEKLSVGDGRTEEKEKLAKEVSQTVADKAKEDGEKEDEPASSPLR